MLEATNGNDRIEARRDRAGLQYTIEYGVLFSTYHARDEALPRFGIGLL